MPQFKIMIARFPFGGVECDTVTDWLVETVMRMKADPRVAPQIARTKINDTPITMSRNLAVERAKAVGADLLLMVDSDMAPDLYLGKEPNAKPFWNVAFEHVINHAGPCVAAAPYCGPPPHENVFIFRVANKQSDHPNVDWGLAQYGREEAAARTGIEKVAALPTGLMLVDMRAFKHVAPPYFEYEFDQPYQTQKHTTEDVYFSRNMALVGVPQYCLWDCWAGHWKRKCVGKPAVTVVEDVGLQLREALVNQRSETEKLVMVGDGKAPLNVETVRAEVRKVVAAAEAEHSPAGERRPEPARNHRGEVLLK